MIRVMAFDLFGTIFDMSKIPRQEISDYIRHIRQKKWEPLELPKSWEKLKPFNDCDESLEKIRNMGIKVVTCSNAPIKLQHKLDRYDFFDHYIDLSQVKAYKPHPDTYSLIFQEMGVQPCECAMVTGNEGSPDPEGSELVGIKPLVIRKANRFKLDLWDLAEALYAPLPDKPNDSELEDFEP